MGEDLTLREFLKALSNCTGDEAIDLIGLFQSSGLSVEGIFVDDLNDE
jgi:hypothetical protein